MDTIDMEKLLEFFDDYDRRKQFYSWPFYKKMTLFFLFEQKKNSGMTEFDVSRSQYGIQVKNSGDDIVIRIEDLYYLIVSPFDTPNQLHTTFYFESDGVKWTQNDGNCCVCGDDEAFDIAGKSNTQFEINGIKIIGYKCIGCHSDNKKLCPSAFKGETCKKEIIKDNVASLFMCLGEWGIPKDVIGVIGGSVVDVACCV
jgi:hypothetical protein